MIKELVDYVFIAILGLLPLANPFSTAPLFISMTSHMNQAERRKVARDVSLYMATVLLSFLIAGTLILEFFGISLHSLRTAGGLIIGLIGFRMLFPQPKNKHANIDEPPLDGKRISFSPLAVPSLSGPGAIAAVVGFSAEAQAHQFGEGLIFSYIFIGIGIVLTGTICWLVLRASDKVVKFFGPTGIDALTRIMGLFLVCIGVEFVAGGIKGLFLLE